MQLLEKAMVLALRAHDGQMRKEALTPYIVHPLSVALIVSRYGFEDYVIAAALVHDLVEDTPVSLEEVRRELGDRVADIVAPVTHDDTLSWEDKKRSYIESVRLASDDAKAVATADKIANAKSLLDAYETQGTGVWDYFNAGKEKKLWFEKTMLEMLQQSWEHNLVDEYAVMVSRMCELE